MDWFCLQKPGNASVNACKRGTLRAYQTSYFKVNSSADMNICFSGVVTAEDGNLYLPASASQQDMIQCLAWGNLKGLLQQQGMCSIGCRNVNLWELHNAFVILGGRQKVSMHA
jgi:hypothetical protein